jgi:hypothetical protein
MNTSDAAFEEIKRTGRLRRLRLQVFEVLWRAGSPKTANEVHALLSLAKPVNKPSVTPRLIELVRMDAVAEIGVRACDVTGFQCVAYAPTGRLPQPLPKRVGFREGPKDRLIRILRGENEALKAKLARWGRPKDSTRRAKSIPPTLL